MTGDTFIFAVVRQNCQPRHLLRYLPSFGPLRGRQSVFFEKCSSFMIALFITTTKKFYSCYFMLIYVKLFQALRNPLFSKLPPKKA